MVRTRTFLSEIALLLDGSSSHTYLEKDTKLFSVRCTLRLSADHSQESTRIAQSEACRPGTDRWEGSRRA